MAAGASTWRPEPTIRDAGCAATSGGSPGPGEKDGAAAGVAEAGVAEAGGGEGDGDGDGGVFIRPILVRSFGSRPAVSRCLIDSRTPCEATARQPRATCDNSKGGDGAPGADRTRDPWLRRPVLYPLSYGRIAARLGSSGARRILGFRAPVTDTRRPHSRFPLQLKALIFTARAAP